MNKFDFVAISALIAVLVAVLVAVLGVVMSLLSPLDISSVASYLIVVGSLGIILFFLAHIVVRVIEISDRSHRYVYSAAAGIISTLLVISLLTIIIVNFN